MKTKNKRALVPKPTRPLAGHDLAHVVGGSGTKSQGGTAGTNPLYTALTSGGVNPLHKA